MMDLEKMIGLVLSSKNYKECKNLTFCDFSAPVARYNLTRHQVAHMRRVMVDRGLIVQVATGVYQNPPSDKSWLYKPWRQHSNEELGIA